MIWMLSESNRSALFRKEPLMSETSTETRENLVAQIRELAPWHHNLQLTPDLSTGEVFSAEGRLLPRDNDGVSLISPRQRFVDRVTSIYPDGMQGKRFLDCACNAGAYCFFAREMGADFSVGFDVREHWIRQARFVQTHRTVEPTDRIEFRTMDLYDLPGKFDTPFDLVYFSGIFYHLPDPITGLKYAAELASDVIVLNTAMVAEPVETEGLTMVTEGTKPVMSGVYELAWFPNNVATLTGILRWMGFRAMTKTQDNINPAGRRRVEIIAAREPGRLDGLAGEKLA